MINIFTNPLASQFPIDASALPVYEFSHQSADYDVMQSLGLLMFDNNKLSDLNTQLMNPKTSVNEMKGILKSFLPSLDSFDRILKAAEQSPTQDELLQNWIISIQTIHTKLLQTLQKVGLEPIDSIGKPIDLNCHEVVEYRKTQDYPHNTVIDEVSRGYLFKGETLREAQVIVACN